jgi:sulfatase modifying factor 1
MNRAAHTPNIRESLAWNRAYKAWHRSQRGRLACNVKDGSVMVRIPAGEFGMGYHGDGYDCPRHIVELSEYWIGVHCVTNRQYARFVEETGYRAPEEADSDFYGDAVWKNGRCPAEKLDHPVVWVNSYDCAAYATWASLSLPSEAQWEKAARGPRGFIYPWGNEWDEEKCRNGGNRYGETTAAVWEYPEDSGGYGTLQQSGNVGEWCADWYGGNYYEESPAKDPLGPSSGSARVFRGGSWYDDDASDFRGARRFRRGLAHRLDYQGFRLVRNIP